MTADKASGRERIEHCRACELACPGYGEERSGSRPTRAERVVEEEPGKKAERAQPMQGKRKTRPAELKT
jgi:hypothetical protein